MYMVYVDLRIITISMKSGGSPQEFQHECESVLYVNMTLDKMI